MKHKREIVFGLFCVCVVAMTFITRGDTRALSAAKTDEKIGVKLPVIMYHQVLDNRAKLGKYVISPDELEHDLKLIKKKGFTTITVGELIDYYDGKGNLPEKPIMLTFDDGYETDFANVFPLLKEYNMKAVFSVVGAYAEKYSENVHKHINYAHLSWDEISEMNESGLAEFANHSYNLHSFSLRRGCLKAKGESEWHYEKMINEDFELSQNLFTSKIGKPPVCFTYPFGCTNGELLGMVRKYGFAASLGTYERVNVLTGDREELYDIRRFNRPHGYNIEKVLKQAE